MAVSLLGPFNKVINDTATQIVDSEIPQKISGVINTLVTSSFGVVDAFFRQVQDLTREEPASKAKAVRKAKA